MLWRTHAALLSIVCLLIFYTPVFYTPALAQKQNRPRLGDIRFTGIAIRDNRDIPTSALGREFMIWVSIASTVPVIELFVEAVALDGGKTQQVSWDGGPISPPIMCCTLEIPFTLPLEMKYRHIEFRVWVKDAKKRVSNKLTHRIFIYD